MACMEHRCLACDHCWFNNQTEVRCPSCGAGNIHSMFDEPPELDYDREEEYDYE